LSAGQRATRSLAAHFCIMLPAKLAGPLVMSVILPDGSISQANISPTFMSAWKARWKAVSALLLNCWTASPLNTSFEALPPTRHSPSRGNDGFFGFALRNRFSGYTCSHFPAELSYPHQSAADLRAECRGGSAGIPEHIGQRPAAPFPEHSLGVSGPCETLQSVFRLRLCRPGQRWGLWR